MRTLSQYFPPCLAQCIAQAGQTHQARVLRTQGRALALVSGTPDVNLVRSAIGDVVSHDHRQQSEALLVHAVADLQAQAVLAVAAAVVSPQAPFIVCGVSALVPVVTEGRARRIRGGSVALTCFLARSQVARGEAGLLCVQKYRGFYKRLPLGWVRGPQCHPLDAPRMAGGSPTGRRACTEKGWAVRQLRGGRKKYERSLDNTYYSACRTLRETYAYT